MNLPNHLARLSASFDFDANVFDHEVDAILLGDLDFVDEGDVVYFEGRECLGVQFGFVRGAEFAEKRAKRK